MSSELSIWSFHSVKGGVGKSTLATLTAVQLAHDHPDEKVWLVDMDLTGTSLADVLPLRAPRCRTIGATGRLDLRTQPLGVLSLEETAEAVLDRDAELGEWPLGVPFLNDHLLFATEDWDEEHDVDLAALAWVPAEHTAPGNLSVLPSSALPRDLDAILPVIFDEEHAAFLENRLEYLLAGMVAEPRRTHVVFDVPPTIPGLSRAVLSLALRLGRGGEKLPLSLDGGFPWQLESTPICWRAVMIATRDVQDVRAMLRWLARVQPDEQDVFQVLINRTPEGYSEALHRDWIAALARDYGAVNALFESAALLAHKVDLGFFGSSQFPGPRDEISALLAKLESQ